MQEELVKALTFCAEMLEMLCPDTAGTPAAQNAREILARLGSPKKAGLDYRDGETESERSDAFTKITFGTLHQDESDPAYNNHPASWR